MAVSSRRQRGVGAVRVALVRSRFAWSGPAMGAPEEGPADDGISNGRDKARRLKTLLVSAAAAVPVATVGIAAPAAADPPTVTETHIGPRPGPFFTALCGFPVTGEIFGTFRVFAVPDAGGQIFYHETAHRTGYFTGPTGKTITITTTQNIVHRLQPDGTLVDVRSGRISVLESGHSITDMAAGETAFVGHARDGSEYCAAMAP